MKSKTLLIALVALIAVNLAAAQGFIQLGAPFGENMVVQQGVPIPFWGSGCPGGDYVKVLFNGQNRNAHCDWMGNWYVEFAPMKAGGPYQLLMEIGGQGPLIPNPAANTRGVELNDVLIGEVVLAPVQSGRPLSATTDGAAETAAAKYPWVRMYRAPAGEQDGPGQWTVVSPITVSGFSASAYFLARELYNKLKVPIGVVDSSNGVQCSALQTSAAPQFCLAQSSSLLAPFRQGIGVDMLVAAEAHVVVARLDVTDAAPAFSRVASLRRAWNAKSGNQFFF